MNMLLYIQKLLCTFSLSRTDLRVVQSVGHLISVTWGQILPAAFKRFDDMNACMCDSFVYVFI